VWHPSSLWPLRPPFQDGASARARASLSITKNRTFNVAPPGQWIVGHIRMWLVIHYLRNLVQRPDRVPAGTHSASAVAQRRPGAPRAPGRPRQCDDRTMTEEAEAHKARDTRDTHDARDTPVTAAAEAEVADICRDLIRIDTTNPGDHSGPGERAAAEYVAGLLGEVGLEPAVLESHPKRTSLVARVPGEDRNRPALLIHGHLFRPAPVTGNEILSAGRSRTAACGGAARST